MRLVFIFIFAAALTSCRTVGKNSEPSPPVPRIPLNPDFKEGQPVNSPEGGPAPTTPIPLPSILTPDPPSAPAPASLPEPKFFHILPSQANPDELDFLIQHGACYSYSEGTIVQLAAARREQLREGECPSQIEITAPVKGRFMRRASCWLNQASTLVGSLTLYDTTYVKSPDGEYKGQSRGSPQVMTECAEVFGALRAEFNGVIIRDEVSGIGETIIQAGMRIRVHYKLKIKGTEITEDSRTGGRPLDFALGAGQVIAGWDLGLSGMRKGGKRWLSIPPRLAHGEEGNEMVPPNATLEFEVELIDVLYDITKLMSLKNLTPPEKVGASWESSFEITKNSEQLQSVDVACRVRAHADFKNGNGAIVEWGAESEFSKLAIKAGQQSTQGKLVWIFDSGLSDAVSSVDSSSLKKSVFSCEVTIKI